MSPSCTAWCAVHPEVDVTGPVAATDHVVGPFDAPGGREGGGESGEESERERGREEKRERGPAGRLSRRS